MSPHSHFPVRFAFSLFLFAFTVALLFGQTPPRYQDLHDFGGKVINANGKLGPDGVYPVAEVVVNYAGEIFGTTYQGGAYGKGMLWELTVGGVYKDIHDFGGKVIDAEGKIGPDGANPAAGLSLDAAGNLYGSTFCGGPNLPSEGGAGILWRFSNIGVYKDLHDFGGILLLPNGQKLVDGANPVAQVDLSSDGTYIMGTAESGGSYGGGVLWEITPSQGYTVLHSFGSALTTTHTPDGSCPTSNIVFDIAGNAYGTTEFGGAQLTMLGGGGIIWKLTPKGVYSDYFDFGGGGSGQWPVGPIVSDLVTIFGTCTAGGTYGFGTYWINGGDWYDFGGTTVNTSGHKGPDGAYPTGFSGSGTATYGGLYDQEDGGDGIVWQTSNLNLTDDLHDFGGTIVNANGKTGPDGIGPAAPPASDRNFNLIGTTQFGGPNDSATGGDGMLWRLVASQISITMDSAQVTGGEDDEGYVTMTLPASSSGAVFSLKSSSPDVVVPSSVTVPAGDERVFFTIETKPVTANTPVTITASQGGQTATATITVLAVNVASVAVTPNPVVGGTSCSGTVLTNLAAPAGGTTITLSSSSKQVSVPKTVVVAAGAKIAKFPVTVSAVAANETATIYAKTNSTVQTATLTIEPAPVLGISVTPSTFVGGSTTQVLGKVVLNAPAPAGGAVVAITSSLPSAVAVPATLSIPAGATSASFVLKHYAVSKDEIVTITAKYGKTPATIALNVTS
jgi:hypothetical protein